jgi:hypothetical protein
VQRAQILVGLLVVAIGTGLLVDRAGSGTRLLTLAWHWWPLVLIGLGLVNLVRLVHGQWALLGPLLAIATGVALLLWTFGFTKTPGYPLMWPTALVVAGSVVALAGTSRGDDRRAKRGELRRFVCFGGTHIVNRANPFWRASLTVLFGHLWLDLREATLHEQGVAINTYIFFGTIHVIVPGGTDIYVRRPFVLGPRGRESSDAPHSRQARLTISVIGVFGTVIHPSSVASSSSETPREHDPHHR